MDIFDSGVGFGAVGFWATAIPVIVSSIETPMPAAMRWIIVKEGCWLDSRENRPILFI
jgi:hypothetical protein